MEGAFLQMRLFVVNIIHKWQKKIKSKSGFKNKARAIASATTLVQG